MPPETVTAPDCEDDLVALLGSRLCHDLISPLGAISNGVELLAMSDRTDSPELQLIAQSVAAANARLKFFRVAFGQAKTDQRLGRSEICATLDGLSGLGRVHHDWQVAGDHPRREVKQVYLAILCLETALPFGGTITVCRNGTGWHLRARSRKARPDPELWSLLDGNGVADIAPSKLQFALLPRALAQADRPLRWKISEDGGEIWF